MEKNNALTDYKDDIKKMFEKHDYEKVKIQEELKLNWRSLWKEIEAARFRDKKSRLIKSEQYSSTIPSRKEMVPL